MTMDKKLGKINEKWLFIINALIIYILIYFVAYQVPMHSDDYTYLIKGLSLQSHIDHYLTWSGRVITDYTASILLNVFSRPVYMAINSAVFAFVIIMITVIPNVINGKKLINKHSSMLLWIIFMLYWAANPNLGQTSFWLVGSANYLWPLMWASLYISYLMYLLVNDQKPSIVQGILLFILGIFAGLTNEALGITVVVFTLFLIPLFWKNGTKALAISLISTGIGYAIVFFSPGNDSRLHNDAFTTWREMPFAEKIMKHFFERIPEALGSFYLLYLILILMLIIALWTQSGKKTDINTVWFPIVFVLMSLCAVVVFVISPGMPPRSINSSFYFALLAVSYIGNQLLCSETKTAVFSLCAAGLICLFYFVPSYAFVHYAYKQTAVQADIRIDNILDAKANGSDTAVVPNWFFTRLAREADKFDTYAAHRMTQYYGVDYIDWKDTTFNYAVIRTSEPISVNKEIKDGLTLTNAYIKINSLFEQTIVLEFDKPVLEYIEDGDRVFYMHLYVDWRDDYIRADVDLDDFIEIDGKYYYGKTVLNPSLKKLEKINFGFYNPGEQTSSVECSLELAAPKDSK